MTQNLIHNPLFEDIKDYLNSSEDYDTVYLIVPYIKTTILKKLIDEITCKIVIITNWETQNLLAGSSELELYPFCKKQNITLYINKKIHLKVYSIGLESAILATGNISQRGLLPEGNYECGVFVEKLSNNDVLTFEKIRNEAILMSDKIYEKLLEWYKKQPKEQTKQNEFDKIMTLPVKDHFLISALPMTRDVFELVEEYEKMNLGLELSCDQETRSCIFHDLANYNIELGLSKEDFLKILKINFFLHPFIQKIDEFISPEAYFGSIKEWIQNNCTDVPIPSRRELTGNVQVLYDWFEKLGDRKYVVDVPGAHSQRIRKTKN